MQTEAATEEVSITETLAKQNDLFRKTLTTVPFNGVDLRGRVVMTPGIAALETEDLLSLLADVRAYDAFNPDNDHGEHDMAFITRKVGGVETKFYFKIDYYSDERARYGSDDPVDPSQTYRIGTLMLASDY